MEALAIIFVIFVFFWLLRDEPKKKDKGAGDKLMDGLVAAAQEIQGKLSSGKSSSDKKKAGLWESPWSIMLITIFLGFFVTSLL